MQRSSMYRRGNARKISCLEIRSVNRCESQQNRHISEAVGEGRLKVDHSYGEPAVMAAKPGLTARKNLLGVWWDWQVFIYS